MRCIYCNGTESRVVDTRATEDGAIRRRRECEQCGRRFTTYEKVDVVPLMVVKKDGSREMFDSGKLRRGILRACEKRPVSMSQISQIVSAIEQRAFTLGMQEVSSGQLGEWVMDELVQVDDVAYVRFASVYRQFRDLETFLEELNRLLTEKRTTEIQKP